MRETLRLSIILMRIPRLFGTLFLFPLIISLVFVVLQTLATAALIKAVHTDGSPTQRVEAQKQQGNFVREILLGQKGTLDPIETCRWVFSHNSEGGLMEIPPPSKPNCKIEKFDVVLRTEHPDILNIDAYVDLLDKKFKRLHLCRNCKTDVIITPETTPVKAYSFSVWGLILLKMARHSDKLITHATEVESDEDRILNTLGHDILDLPGLKKQMAVEDMNAAIITILNIASLVVIALWLALKAHRKVLDYFAASGSLLPLVAASGRGVFYGALWVLTITRVFCFLFSSVPLCWLAIEDLTEKSVGGLIYSGDTAAFFLWAIALISTFCLAALIGSIGDLKNKHSLVSFLYRYVPFALCIVGGICWSISLLIDTSTSQIVRDILSALPLLGMVPVLLAPVFVPSDNILVTQALLSVTLLVVAVRINIRWFGSHLEEI